MEKKALFIGFRSKFLKKTLEEIYLTEKLSSCFTIDANPLDLSENIKISQSFDFYKILNGDYPIEIIDYPPLSYELLSYMTFPESIMLKMYDRVYNKEYSYAARKNLYHKHLKFWSNFLVKNEIKFVIASNSPHECFDYIISYLCEKYSIKFMNFFQLPFLKSYIIVQEDYPKRDRQIENELKKTRECWESIKNKMHMKSAFSNYYDNLKSSQGKIKPHYMNKSHNEGSHYAILKKFKKIFKKSSYSNIKEKLINRVNIIKKVNRNKKSNSYLEEYYSNKTIYPDYTKPFVYIPLHFQPEMTTSPLGSFFVFQEIMVEIVAKAFKGKATIYVKEHPSQSNLLWLSRNKEFYDNLIQHSNVQLIPKHISTFELISKSLAVATISGMAGWESLYHNKPVLLFCDNYYYDCSNGVFKIKSLKTCQKAAARIINGETPSRNDFEQVLYAISKVAIPGVIEEVYRDESKKLDKDYAKKIALKVSSYISKKKTRKDLLMKSSNNLHTSNPKKDRVLHI